MKRLIIVAVLFLSPFSHATTSVTGKIQTLGTGNITSGAFARFWLRGCGGNQPRINGTATIGPSQGGVFYFDISADSGGNVTGTIYSTRDATGLLGGEIECGGSKLSVWYGLQIFVAGKGGPESPIHAKNSATLDITQVTPITTNPVVTSPTGDSTYARLDGGNQPFTGNISPSGNGTLNMGTSTNRWKLFASTLDVSGNSTLGGTLGVTGATTLSSTLGVTSNTTVGGTLGVTGNATLSGTLWLSGLFVNYNGFSTAGDGIPTIVGVFDQLNNSADFGTQLLLTGTAQTVGMYRVSLYVVVTTPATSSTMPSSCLAYSDRDSSGTVNILTASSTGNTTSTVSQSTSVINLKASNSLFVATGANCSGGTTYASNPAATMKYAVHAVLEKL